MGTAMGGLRSNQQAYQHCFIGHSQGASWRETFEQVCEEILPHFNLKPWYANKYYKGNIPLRQKVVDMIATTRYGIYDLSYWRENDKSAWIMPRNVLIELGMAIALNRPMLLLRHGENRESGLILPACLEGIEIGEFGDGKKLLKETLHKHLPSLMRHTPTQDWYNRYCHFGGLECSYREAHPQAQRWGRQKIHIHVSDGAHAAHIDCSDFHDMIEDDVISRFNNLEFNYLDSLVCPQGHKFLLCSRCQEVRSSPFAIYRITPHTSAGTFIAIGMSIALEKQFNYPITKILITDDEDSIPSLLKGYEIIVERNYVRIKERLNSILPAVIEETKQAIWRPKPLPFEVFLPTKGHIEIEQTTLTEVHTDSNVQKGEGDSSLQEREEGLYDLLRSDKFTDQTKKALHLALEDAQMLRHDYIDTEHLLLGLIREGGSIAAKVLANLGIEYNKVRSYIEFIMGRGDHIVLYEPRLTPLAKKAIKLAADEARRLNHQYIGIEHLLLGLIRNGEGIATGVLESFDVNLENVRIQTIQVLSQQDATQSSSSQSIENKSGGYSSPPEDSDIDRVFDYNNRGNIALQKSYIAFSHGELVGYAREARTHFQNALIEMDLLSVHDRRSLNGLEQEVEQSLARANEILSPPSHEERFM